MKLLFIAILLAPLANAAYSREFYVSNNGSDRNSGTMSSPWSTLEMAEKAAGSDDKIYLQRGSAWTAQFIFRGNNMIIDAYGAGPSPVIDGSSRYFSVAIVGKSNITIRNIRMINAANDCIRVEQNGIVSHNILIEDNVISGCHRNGINISPSDADISANKLPYDIRIENNQISHCGNAAVQIRAQSDIGINKIAFNVIDKVGMIYPTNAISLNHVHNIVVEHNTITNTGSTNIDGSGITADYLNKNVTGSGSIIRYNSIVCPTPPANDEQAGIAIWHQPNVKVYNNTIRNCNEGIRVSGATSTGYNIHHNVVIGARKRGASFTSSASHGIFENNNISGVNNNDVGIWINRGSSPPDENNNNIYNFHTGMHDMNKPSATLHITDTNIQSR